MEVTALRNEMMKLWKDTFHDSDEYVSLVFDAYFDPRYVEYEESDGALVAALMGVPYSFGNAERSIKALYLCGLATKPSHRSRGIMTRMLSRINSRAAEEGFAFTFLIPSDPGLRKYYHDRDYVNAFYRVVDNYTSLHDFDLEYESILLEQKEKVATLKRHYYDSLAPDLITRGHEDLPTCNATVRFMQDIESMQSDLQIMHSEGDAEVALRENIISGGSVYIVRNPEGEVTAAAFTSRADNRLNVHKLYSRDLASKYKVLADIKRRNPELGISHYVSSLEMDRKALWFRTYGSFMADASQVGTISVTERVYSLAAHAKVYGMAKILNLHEILKFQAEQRRDLKYSILTKGEDPYVFEQIDVRNGKLSVKKLSVDTLTPAQTAHVMSRRDIGEILFRRRDTDNLITEAFGIPSINASASLLLD